MGKMSIADRVKQGPLSAKWKQLSTKNKDISALKGDVDGDLADYDKNLKQAEDADAAEQKAWQTLASTADGAIQRANKIIDGHMDALAKLKKSMSDDWGKRAAVCDRLAKTDIPKAMDAVSELLDSNSDSLSAYNAIFQDIIDARKTSDADLKKAYADARKDVDDSEAQKKKLESACDSLEDSVRKTVGDMMKQAIKQSQDKLATVLDGFLKLL